MNTSEMIVKDDEYLAWSQAVSRFAAAFESDLNRYQALLARLLNLGSGESLFVERLSSFTVSVDLLGGVISKLAEQIENQTDGFITEVNRIDRFTP